MRSEAFPTSAQCFTSGPQIQKWKFHRKLHKWNPMGTWSPCTSALGTSAHCFPQEWAGLPHTKQALTLPPHSKELDLPITSATR